MKFKGLLLFLVMMLLVTGCGEKKEDKENVDINDVTESILEETEKARKEAAEDSAYGLRKSVNLYYQIGLIENVEGFAGDTITFNDGAYKSIAYSTQAALEAAGFELYGEIPSSGKIVINSEGSATYSNIVINGYNCDIPELGEITCSK